ncbi:MAG: energy-coupling factor transporter ATPase [Nitrospirota bacterium]
MRAIEIKDVSYAYQDMHYNALNRMNLDVHNGELVVLMGKSGAGKSTLCRLLNALIPKFYKGRLYGTVEVFNELTFEKEVFELAKDIGMVFQNFESQLFSTNVELECAFAQENFGVQRNEIADSIKESLFKVGLTGFEKRNPSTLSGGEKQRLAIASVLAMKPKILVMDEPTTDLDPLGKSEIFAICALLKEEGVTLVLVEHEIEVAGYADKIILMDQGEMVLEGKPDEVLRKIKLLEKCGIRPPQIPRLFQELQFKKKLPLTYQEAYQIFLHEDWQIPEGRYNVLKWQNTKRMEKYQDSVIEIADLEYFYPDGNKVLNGIDLTIRQGEFVAILGQNGSGKTTLIKHFNGLLKPTKGNILISGVNTRRRKVSDLAKEVGFVFQNPDCQIFAETVFDEVAFGPRNLLEVEEKEISKRVYDALGAVQLNIYGNEDPFALTKGEKQKLAVASVLACIPKILILDEPTTGLDYHEIISIMNLLVELNNRGHTIIIVTHSMWVAAEYAQRIVVLDKGKIILDGTPRMVLKEEDTLKKSHLLVPEIVSLSNMLSDMTLLSVEEFKFCLLD